MRNNEKELLMSGSLGRSQPTLTPLTLVHPKSTIIDACAFSEETPYEIN